MKRTFNPEFLVAGRDPHLHFAVGCGPGSADSRVAGATVECQFGAQGDVTISVTDDAKKWIIEKTASDRTYGARPAIR